MNAEEACLWLLLASLLGFCATIGGLIGAVLGQ